MPLREKSTQVKEHLSWEASNNIKKIFSFTLVSLVYTNLDSSALVYNRPDLSNDSSTLVYIRLDLPSDSSTLIYIRIDLSRLV